MSDKPQVSVTFEYLFHNFGKLYGFNQSQTKDCCKIIVIGTSTSHTSSLVCADMKHRKKEKKLKTHRRKHKDKSEKTHHKKDRKERLKQLAMASGFQASNLPSTSSDGVLENEDEILVVFDKQEDERMKESGKKSETLKFSINKQLEVSLKDIPLPPAFSYVSGEYSIGSLDDIPLPPMPVSNGTSESKDFNYCEVEQLKTLVKSIRKWEHTPFGETLLTSDRKTSPSFSSPKSFSIMSYNVLAQRLLEDHIYLYRKHDPEALSWENRSKTLLAEIQEADPDILCLQEVQASHLNSFFSKLKDLGYEGLYKQRSPLHADGCAIYFKTDKLKLISSNTVEYFQCYTRRFDCSILDRFNIALIARLAFQNSSDPRSEFIVATTHLLYNPRRQDVKLAQTQVLLAELDRVSFIGLNELTGKPSYLPTIVTGDFNMVPESAVYRLLTQGFLQYSDLASKSLSNALYGQARQEHLLPFELQISHSCQHLGLLLHRLRYGKQGNRGSEQEKVHISQISKLYNSDIYKSKEEYFQKHSKIPLLYEEDFNGRVQKGLLHHCLNLKSVYLHQRHMSPGNKKVVKEATTHQDDWITVDYIFYSGTLNDLTDDVEEGPLKLLSRYTLPTVGQCNQLKSIPNRACGSDHFSLMAYFLLDAYSGSPN